MGRGRPVRVRPGGDAEPARRRDGWPARPEPPVRVRLAAGALEQPAGHRAHERRRGGARALRRECRLRQPVSRPGGLERPAVPRRVRGPRDRQRGRAHAPRLDRVRRAHPDAAARRPSQHPGPDARRRARAAPDRRHAHADGRRGVRRAHVVPRRAVHQRREALHLGQPLALRRVSRPPGGARAGGVGSGRRRAGRSHARVRGQPVAAAAPGPERGGAQRRAVPARRRSPGEARAVGERDSVHQRHHVQPLRHFHLSVTRWPRRERADRLHARDRARPAAWHDRERRHVPGRHVARGGRPAACLRRPARGDAVPRRPGARPGGGQPVRAPH